MPAIRWWPTSTGRTPANPIAPADLPDGSPLLKDIENYNREDCKSTVLLHDWLRNLRREQGLPEQPLQLSSGGARSPRSPGRWSNSAPSSWPNCRRTLQSDPAGQRHRCSCSPPRKKAARRGMSWRVQRLLAQLLPFHHREAKVAWWAYFDRRNRAELSPGDLVDDGEAIAEARWKSVEPRESKLTGADYHTFSFDPAQPLKLRADSGDRGLQLEIPETGLKVSVESLDAERGRVTLKLPWKKRDQRRADGLGDGIPDRLTSLIKVPADISEKLRESLLEQANAWLDGNQALPPAMLQLLERQPIAELVALNSAIAAEPDSVASRLASFLANSSGCHPGVAGPTGHGQINGDRPGDRPAGGTMASGWRSAPTAMPRSTTC